MLNDEDVDAQASAVHPSRVPPAIGRSARARPRAALALAATLAAALAAAPPRPPHARPAAIAQAPTYRVHLPVALSSAAPVSPVPAPSSTGTTAATATASAWATAGRATASATVATTPSATPDATPDATPPAGADFAPFGAVALAPERWLEGSGTTIDSLAFWAAPDPADSLLLVTAKGNQRVEVWPAPFDGFERPPLQHPSFGSGTQVNGIAVDQARDRVYVAVSRPASTVAVFALPDLGYLGQIVAGAVDLRSEPNLALLTLGDGARRLYVSADDRAYAFDPDSGAAVGGFAPARRFETLWADDHDQILYVPDETMRSGVYAYDPDGHPVTRGGLSRLGADGVFDADAEGITAYTCRDGDGRDDGRGWLIVSDQRAGESDFEFFDRRSWTHLGRLRLEGVGNTDGIASTQQPLPGHPAGLFAAVDDDARVALVGWERVATATGLGCGGRGTADTTAAPRPAGAR